MRFEALEAPPLFGQCAVHEIEHGVADQLGELVVVAAGLPQPPEGQLRVVGTGVLELPEVGLPVRNGEVRERGLLGELPPVDGGAGLLRRLPRRQEFDVPI